MSNREVQFASKQTSDICFESISFLQPPSTQEKSWFEGEVEEEPYRQILKGDCNTYLKGLEDCKQQGNLSKYIPFMCFFSIYAKFQFKQNMCSRSG